MAEGRKRRDPYEVLGVARDAEPDVIRKAYRRLARQHHPDVNPGDDEAEARFKDISEAWAILSDPEKRRSYDEFGDVALEAGFDAAAARRAREAFGERFGAGAGAGGATGGPFEFHFGFDDLLERAFRGGRRGAGRGPRRGADLETTLELDFLDAVRGGERRLELARPGDAAPVRESVTVRIPAGVADGGRIRIPGKGLPVPGGGPAGDLWATIRVRPHPVFRREGRDIFIEVPISVIEAIEGAKVEIPTLEGRAVLTIPPGTDSGRRLRLRGKGVPDPSGGERGDLYALVQIRVPRDLDEPARAALKSLERFDPPDLRKDLFQ